MFQHLMKNRIERALVLCFAVALSLSIGGTIASFVSTAFEKVNQALTVPSSPAMR